MYGFMSRRQTGTPASTATPQHSRPQQSQGLKPSERWSKRQAASKWGKLKFQSVKDGGSRGDKYLKYKRLINEWLGSLDTMTLSELTRERHALKADILSFPLSRTSQTYKSSSPERPYFPEHAFAKLDKRLSERRMQSSLDRADTEARKRGFDSASDMAATQDVETEWYEKKYGATSAAKREAYKQLEREQFGKTSFEAVMMGETDPQFVGQSASTEARADEIAQTIEVEENIALQQRAYEENQRALKWTETRKNLMYGAIALAIGIGGYMWFVKD